MALKDDYNLVSFGIGVVFGATVVANAALGTGLAVAVTVGAFVLRDKFKLHPFAMGFALTVTPLIFSIANSYEPQTSQDIGLMHDVDKVQMIQAPNNIAMPLTPLGTSFAITVNPDVMELINNTAPAASLYKFKMA